MMHRDLKSENIIRKTKDGDWKICDYGLSRIVVQFGEDGL
jgi:serine/threonine protein kinase